MRCLVMSYPRARASHRMDVLVAVGMDVRMIMSIAIHSMPCITDALSPFGTLYWDDINMTSPRTTTRAYDATRSIPIHTITDVYLVSSMQMACDGGWG